MNHDKSRIFNSILNKYHYIAFRSVKEHFDCEFPYVGFVYKKSGEQCSISLNNERAVNLATLLSKYTPLDPRLTQLASLFRYWGKVNQFILVFFYCINLLSTIQHIVVKS